MTRKVVDLGVWNERLAGVGALIGSERLCAVDLGAGTVVELAGRRRLAPGLVPRVCNRPKGHEGPHTDWRTP